MDFTKFVDAYTARARLLPALLTILPLATTVYAWDPGSILGWNGLGALLTAFGGMILLSFIARDLGKRVEQSLFKKWGGRPTELALMHSGPLDPALRNRRHAALSRAFPDVPLPTAVEEAADRDTAMKRYITITGLIIGHCRKKEDFPLIFEENCNYGFRRNMLGMKPIGVTISAISSLALGLMLFMAFSLHVHVPAIAIALEAVNVAMFLVWALWVNESMVRKGAELYNARLFEAVDTIRPAAA